MHRAHNVTKLLFAKNAKHCARGARGQGGGYLGFRS